MATSALISTSNPDHSSLLRRLDMSIETYGLVFLDADRWRPFVELVCSRHAVEPRMITSGAPGSFPTFIVNRTHVVKFFGPLLDGLDCWHTEIEVAAMLGRTVPIPDVIGAGVVAESPPWRYIVSRFVDGEAYDQVRDRLDTSQRIRLARALGMLIRRVHDRDVPLGRALAPNWENWTAFIDIQRRDLANRHRAWGKLPEHLILHLDRYVDDYRIETSTAPVLVHADLHEQHVFGSIDGDREWRISGVIDWGDARIGDRFYELPALHLGLFRGDGIMLSAFLEAYGWPGYRTDSFARRAMTMTLLHEFNVLAKYTFPDDVQALDQLAENLWRV